MAAAVSEDQVARAVFDETSHAAAAHAPNSPRGRRSRDRRPAAATSGAGRQPALPPLRADAVPCWTTARHRSQDVVVLCEVTRISRGGCLADRRVVPLGIALSSAPATRRDWARVMARIAADARVLERASRHAGELLAADVEGAGPDRVVRRIGALRARLLHQRPRLVQTSLFDQRAVRAAATDREVLRRIDEHLARRARQLEEIAEAFAPGAGNRAPGTGPDQTRLIAAWPLARPERSR
jgi:hypothetical protein